MIIKQALISVSDKTGIIELAQGLCQFGVTILSTGGTAKLLRDSGINVTEVSDYTNFPEMLDGRVKTLHPKIHAGILARKELPGHRMAMEKMAIPTIDLVVVNLYPFSWAIAQDDCDLEKAIENIDIGGPTMIRGAAKNYKNVAVVTDSEDYASLLNEMQIIKGEVSENFCFKLACKAFSYTAIYDSAISNYLTAIDFNGQRQAFSERLNLNFKIAQSCVTERILIRGPHFIVILYQPLADLLITLNCKERSCLITTLPMQMPHGSVLRPSICQHASLLNMPILAV